MMTSTITYLSMFTVTSILIEILSRVKAKRVSEKVIKILLLLLSLSIPAFFSGIRYGVGTDYFSYEKIFEQIKMGILGRHEFGYQLINIIVGKLGGNIHVLFFLVSFLMILFIYLFLRNYNHIFSVGLGMFVFLLLFYNFSLNGVRTAFSIGISVFSYKYIAEKNLKKFVVYTLLSMSIHQSAIIVLPFYFLYNKVGSKSKTSQLFIYIGVFLAIFYYQTIVEFVSIYILRDTYYLNYAQNTGETGFGIGLLVKYAPYIILGAIFNKKLSAKNNDFQLYFFLNVIGFILGLLGYIGAGYLQRISEHFFVSAIWLTPFYYETFLNKKKYFWISYLLIIYVIIYWWIVIRLSNETLPYITIFNRN